MKRWLWTTVCSSLFVVVSVGQSLAQTGPDTAEKKAPTPAPATTTTITTTKSLYERLGGEKAITAVVDDFVGRAEKDPKVNFFRKDIPGVKEWKPTDDQLATFKKHLVQFVCMATGGPQKYEGEDMKTAHKAMMITDDEFTAIAKDLSDSLDKFKVLKTEHDELMKIVDTTRDQIVEKTAPVTAKK